MAATDNGRHGVAARAVRGFFIRTGWRGLFFHALIVFIFINMVVVTADCVGTVGQTWTGFSFNYYYRILAADEVGDNTLGQSQPLTMRDTLVLVEGRTPRNFGAAMEAARESGLGRITMLLRRPVNLISTQQVVSLPLQRFGWSDFFANFGSGLFVGWFLFLVGLAVYYLRPEGAVNQAFMLTMLTAGCYILVGYEGVYIYRINPLDVVWFEHLGSVLICFLGATAFHLGANFPSTKPWTQRARWSPYALYPLAAGLGLVAVFAFSSKLNNVVFSEIPDPGLPLLGIDYFFGGFGALALIGGIIIDVIRSREPTVRRQARIVLGGSLVGIGPLLFFYLLPTALGLAPSISFNVGYLFLVAFPLSVAYAIVRYKLFDLNFVLRRTLAYATTSLVVAAAYLLLVTLLQTAFSRITGQNSVLASVISTVGIVLLFSPMYNRLQGIVERSFFRERYIFRQAMLDFNRSLRDIRDEDELGNRLVRGVTAIMDLTGAALYRSANDSNLYLSHQAGPARTSGGLLIYDEATTGSEWPDELELAPIMRDWLAAYNRPLNLATLPTDLPPEGGPLVEFCLRERLAMVIPLVVEERLVSLLLLRRKRTGGGILREDIDLLTALLPQVTLGLRNAQLLAEATGRERIVTEMELASQIQRGLFPREIPQPPGYAIHAVCLPAQETSGDAYDVVTLDEGLALIVADACGKGMAAAMMMGLARNTVRSELGYHVAPAPTLTSANRWLARDLERSFVTLTYMLLDPTAHRITMANAGGLTPLLRRDGKCQYLNSSGPALPLGIISTLR